MATEISVDFGSITDSDGFHSAFSSALGFPEFYGRNMDAWIDCMSYINDPAAGMSVVTVSSEESLDLMISGLEAAFTACPDVVRSFFECAAFVNQRFIDAGSQTRLRIIPTT